MTDEQCLMNFKMMFKCIAETLCKMSHFQRKGSSDFQVVLPRSQPEARNADCQHRKIAERIQVQAPRSLRHGSHTAVITQPGVETCTGGTKRGVPSGEFAPRRVALITTINIPCDAAARAAIRRMRGEARQRWRRGHWAATQTPGQFK